ncbi:MAG: hypothetical protein ACPGSC_05745 [Granulosicoccaceae bacterium]
MNPIHKRYALFTALGMSALTLTACDSSSSSTAAPTVSPFSGDLSNCDATGTATSTDASGRFLIAGRAPDYSSGQIELRNMADGSVSISYPATGSDIRVTTDGEHAYQIGRFLMDNLTKFSLDSDTPIYQYSVNAAEESGSNPYTVVFASENKAYIIRYGYPQIWIVDPTATSEANFKIGEIDLSAYINSTGDTPAVGDTPASINKSPKASNAVLLNGKLYVLMERLDVNFKPYEQGYLAVIDTATDTEIDTGQSSDGLLGIPLGVNNPTNLQYVEANDLFYVVGRGNYFGSYNLDDDDDSNDLDRYTGGIVTVDPASNQASMLLDDGSEDSNIGFFNQLSVVDAGKAYLMNYESYQSSTLLRMDATTGTIEECAINDIKSKDISILGQSPNGQLWIGVNDEQPLIEQIDIGTDQAVGQIETTLPVLNVAFLPE